MEPRIYQFYNNTADTLRPVSPTFSNWSPIVPNQLDTYQEQQEEDQNKSRSQFPVIQRSFAFDEWDEDDEDEEISYDSSDHNGNGNDPRCQPETLVVVPTVEYGHTIYDATQGLVHKTSHGSKVTPPSLDTYMTVIYLDDTMTSKIHNKTTLTSSTSTETFGNNNHDYQQFHHSHSSPFEFVCQSIPRHSMTYRWTTEGQMQTNESPDNGGMEGTDDHSNSSSSSEQHCPIPEYITVYKDE